jgi:hypothetical protein
MATLAQLRERLGAAYAAADVVAIDEAQFFPDLLAFCTLAADSHAKHLLLAGLDGDFRRQRFGQARAGPQAALRRLWSVGRQCCLACGCPDMLASDAGGVNVSPVYQESVPGSVRCRESVSRAEKGARRGSAPARGRRPRGLARAGPAPRSTLILFQCGPRARAGAGRAAAGRQRDQAGGALRVLRRARAVQPAHRGRRAAGGRRRRRQVRARVPAALRAAGDRPAAGGPRAGLRRGVKPVPARAAPHARLTGLRPGALPRELSGLWSALRARARQARKPEEPCMRHRV